MKVVSDSEMAVWGQKTTISNLEKTVSPLSTNRSQHRCDLCWVSKKAFQVDLERAETVTSVPESVQMGASGPKRIVLACKTTASRAETTVSRAKKIVFRVSVAVFFHRSHVFQCVKQSTFSMLSI